MSFERKKYQGVNIKPSQPGEISSNYFPTKTDVNPIKVPQRIPQGREHTGELTTLKKVREVIEVESTSKTGQSKDQGLTPQPSGSWNGSWNRLPTRNVGNSFQKPKRILQLRTPKAQLATLEKGSLEVLEGESTSQSDQLFLHPQDVKMLAMKSNAAKTYSNGTHSRAQEKVPQGFTRYTLKEILELNNTRLQKELDISLFRGLKKHANVPIVPMSSLSNQKKQDCLSSTSNPLSIPSSSSTSRSAFSTKSFQQDNPQDKKQVSIFPAHVSASSFKTNVFSTKNPPRQYDIKEQTANSKASTIGVLTKSEDSSPVMVASMGKHSGTDNLSVIDSPKQLISVSPKTQRSNIPFTKMTGNIKNLTLEEKIDDIKSRGISEPSSNCIRSGPAAKIFHEACVHNRFEIVVNVLYEGKVKVNDVLGQYWTGLQLACYNGQSNIVRLLLKLGADPNFKNKDDMDALMSITSSPHHEDTGLFDCVKLIVEAGVDVNSVQSGGASPLIIAVKRGHLKIARYLLENGANVYHCDGDFKRTALKWATYRNNKAMVKLLKEYEAKSTLKNVIKETTNEAPINEKSELIRLLDYSQTSSLQPDLLIDIMNTSDEKSVTIHNNSESFGSQASDSLSPGMELTMSRSIAENDLHEDQPLKDVLTDLGLHQWSPVMALFCINYSTFLMFNGRDLIKIGVSAKDVGTMLDHISAFNANLYPWETKKIEEGERGSQSGTKRTTNHISSAGNIRMGENLLASNDRLAVRLDNPQEKHDHEEISEEPKESNKNGWISDKTRGLLSLAVGLGVLMTLLIPFRKNNT